MNRTDRSSDEIRRDIDQTRSELDRTLDALAARFSPGQLMDQVWRALRGQGSSAVGQLGDHAVPLALMGLGVAWLAVETSTGTSASRRSGEPRLSDDREPWTQDVAGDGPSPRDRAADWAREAQGRAGEMVGRVREQASALGGHNGNGGHAKERARALSEEGAERARHLAGRGREESRRLARRAGQGFSSLMDESPLALGAAFLGLGLAFGLAVRSTRVEDEWVGEQSEALKQQATDVAQEAAGAARRVARDTAEAARDEARRQDPVGQAMASAEKVAQTASDTARQRAHEEGLDREGVEKRVKEEAERAGEGAEREEHR